MSERWATALEIVGVAVVVAAVASLAFVPVAVAVAGIIAGLYCVWFANVAARAEHGHIRTDDSQGPDFRG